MEWTRIRNEHSPHLGLAVVTARCARCPVPEERSLPSRFLGSPSLLSCLLITRNSVRTIISYKIINELLYFPPST